MASDPLKLIAAVAAGEAEREDVVAALRDEGVDSLDVLIDVLVSATRGRPQPAPLHVLDPQRGAREAVQSVHQVPRLPFLLNGTLYDPGDIKRFDGQELHFIGGTDDDPILAIDDRELYDRWSQFSYISTVSLAKLSPKPPRDGHEGAGVSTTDSLVSGVPSFPALPGPDGPVGPGLNPGIGGPPRAIFFADINYGGNDFECPRNRGYADLTRVSFTWLGTGDWNDTISSYQTSIPLWVRLWEHVNWTGSSHTNFASLQSLLSVGWNDRASSVECW